MSIRVLNEVLRQSEATGHARLALIVLADVAHDDGVGWEKQTSLAAKGRMSERAVRDAIETLIGIGELQRSSVRRGSTSFSIYRVTVGSIADTPIDWSKIPFTVEPPFVDRQHLPVETGRPATTVSSTGNQRRSTGKFRQFDRQISSVTSDGNADEAPAERHLSAVTSEGGPVLDPSGPILDPSSNDGRIFDQDKPDEPRPPIPERVREFMREAGITLPKEAS